MDLFNWLDDEDKKNEEEVSKDDIALTADLFKSDRPLSVSELSDIVRTMVEGIGKVVVKGEIINLSTPKSGHIYFKLKDETSTINAVIWKNAKSKITCKLEEGLEVTLTGKMAVFSARSEYQINVSKVEPAGEGSWLKLFEKRKKMFEEEGLFKEEFKKPITREPKTIAIITSKSGDVFHDILHRIKDRFPCRILLLSTKVQGEGAAEEISNAISLANSLAKKEHIDTIILARGGGSVEDLWSFNEEIVVRSVFNSEVPVISAIGHEPDITLVDYVADLRAPTPTGAAELATSDINNIKTKVLTSKKAIFQSFEEYILRLEQRLDIAKIRINTFDQEIQSVATKLENSKKNLVFIYNSYLNKLQEDLRSKERILKSLSVESILERGFSYVKNSKGQIIKTSKTKEKTVEIFFKDGSRKADLK